MHTLIRLVNDAVLPDNLQQEIMDFVELPVAKSHAFMPKNDVTTQRIACLQRGKAHIAEGFDDPLFLCPLVPKPCEAWIQLPLANKLLLNAFEELMTYRSQHQLTKATLLKHTPSGG